MFHRPWPRTPPARSIAPTRTRETPIIITVMPATVGVMILRRNGMIRLPAMTTNPPMKHTPKRVDSACSHDMPCSFMRRAPTAMSVPGNAKLVAWMLNMPEPIPKGRDT